MGRSSSPQRVKPKVKPQGFSRPSFHDEERVVSDGLVQWVADPPGSRCNLAWLQTSPSSAATLCATSQSDHPAAGLLRHCPIRSHERSRLLHSCMRMRSAQHPKAWTQSVISPIHLTATQTAGVVAGPFVPLLQHRNCFLHGAIISCLVRFCITFVALTICAMTPRSLPKIPDGA
jgi:hypothetical protein